MGPAQTLDGRRIRAQPLVSLLSTLRQTLFLLLKAGAIASSARRAGQSPAWGDALIQAQLLGDRAEQWPRLAEGQWPRAPHTNPVRPALHCPSRTWPVIRRASHGNDNRESYELHGHQTQQTWRRVVHRSVTPTLQTRKLGARGLGVSMGPGSQPGWPRAHGPHPSPSSCTHPLNHLHHHNLTGRW